MEIADKKKIYAASADPGSAAPCAAGGEARLVRLAGPVLLLDGAK